jgi:predicted metal-dependent phosphoesterase TrpH
MLVDMHCHSVSSDDSRATVEGYLKWIQVLRKRGHTIDSIVLTEHRKFDNDFDYSTLGDQYGVLVMKGSELDTACGHFLVYGVNPQLQSAIEFANVRMDPLELMEAATATGAIAIPAHPGRSGIGLCEFIEQGQTFNGLSIVETHNGGSRRGENERAQELADSTGLMGIGGSDAHLVSNIATCLTSFPKAISNERELVQAILGGEFTAVRLEDTSSGNEE